MLVTTSGGVAAQPALPPAPDEDDEVDEDEVEVEVEDELWLLDALEARSEQAPQATVNRSEAQTIHVRMTQSTSARLPPYGVAASRKPRASPSRCLRPSPGAEAGGGDIGVRAQEADDDITSSRCNAKSFLGAREWPRPLRPALFLFDTSINLSTLLAPGRYDMHR